jgi:DNA-binding LacI/PurR family transcriptional regulator
LQQRVVLIFREIHMSVTIDELATRVKLHKGSVSRILGGKGDGYSEQTRQRVLETAAEMGYQPNGLARALWTGSTQMVALWLLTHDSYSPYSGYVHHCLQRLAVQNGYQLITEDIPFGRVNQAEYSRLVRWPVDGILACDVASVASAYRHSMLTRRCPIVCLGQGAVPDSDYVTADFSVGAREAVKHLLQAGCERIAFVCPRGVYDFGLEVEPRAMAYADLMGEAERKPEYIVTSEGSRSAGYQSLQDYVKEYGYPDGLFCFNDEVAIGCDAALHEMGVRVPDDVLLVGFDGLENARLSRSPISSVVIPIEEMCTLAWDVLLQRLQCPEDPLQQQTLIPHLEVRASSRRSRSTPATQTR